MTELKTGTAMEFIYNNLRERITRQELRPGEALTEMYICKDLNVGRSPVRRALQALADDGFVELVPNKGAHVVQFTQLQVKQLYSLRNELEIYALRLTLDVYSNSDFEYLESCLESQRNTFEQLDFDKYIAAVSNFHCYIADKPGNQYLSASFYGVMNRICVYLSLYDNFYSVKKLKSLPLHRKMLDGIREGRIKKVERAMQELDGHIIDAYDHMMLLSEN